MTTQEIEKYLEREFSKKRLIPKKYPEEVIKYIENFTKEHKWTGNLKIEFILKVMQQGYTELPECGLEGCTNQVHLTDRKPYFSKACCKKHNTILTCREKYGVDHPFSSEEVKAKSRNTLLKKYGVDTYTKHKDFLTKRRNNNIEKYGVEEVLQKSSKIREIGELTMLRKFGTKHAMQNNEIKNKRKITNLEKYGVTEVLKSDVIIEKAKQAKIEKYGVDNLFKINDYASNKFFEKYGVSSPGHIPYIVDKMQNNGFSQKEYMWKTGELSILQGYEPIILKELEEHGYTYNEVLTKKSDMPEIWYIFKNKKHRYYPDFYIPSENLIIEVKSKYTLEKEWDKNQAKFEATKKLGFNLRLEVR